MGDGVFRIEVATRDVEVAADMISRSYSGAQMRRPEDGRPFHSTMRVIGDEYLSFMSLDQLASCGGTMPPQSSYVIGEPSVTLRASSGRLQLDATRAFLYPVADVRGDFDQEVRLRMTQIEVATVQQIAAAWSGSERYAVRFTGTAPLSVALERYWSSLVAHARRIADDGELFDNPLIRHDLTQLLALGLLRTFPSNVSDPDTFRNVDRNTLPQAVRRAVSYMEEHASEAVTIAQIAEAARLSPRGLQEAFRRHLGTTPMRYLHRLRLDGSRQDLLAADPMQSSVERIARRWGFTHLSRYANSYRATFSELPSATLRS